MGLKTYEISVVGNVLLFTGYGQWGEITVSLYTKELKRAIDTIKGNDWAFLGDFFCSGVMPFQAEQALIDTVKWRIAKGMKACALVVGNTDTPSVVEAQFSRIYRAAGANFRIFDNQKEANKWLLEQGFSQDN